MKSCRLLKEFDRIYDSSRLLSLATGRIEGAVKVGVHGTYTDVGLEQAAFQKGETDTLLQVDMVASLHGTGTRGPLKDHILSSGNPDSLK